MGKIVWLASYPKSGNTWMRAFIHNLAFEPKTPYDINEMNQVTISDTDGVMWQKAIEGPYMDLSVDETIALRGKVQHFICNSTPGDIMVKTHDMFGDVGGNPIIHAAYTAAAMYVVRNPFDVVHSFADHYGHDLDSAIETMLLDNCCLPHSEVHTLSFMGSWNQHVRSWTEEAGDAVLVIRYEDLHSSPKKTFGMINKYLGFNKSPEKVAKAIRFSSFKSLKKQEAKKGFKERSKTSKAFFRKGESGTGMSKLTTAQIDRMVEGMGPMMEKYGYLP